MKNKLNEGWKTDVFVTDGQRDGDRDHVKTGALSARTDVARKEIT